MKLKFISAMVSMELFVIKNRRGVVQLLAKVLKQADEIIQNNFYYTKELLFPHSNFQLFQTKIFKEDLNDLALEYYDTIQELFIY